MNIKYSYLLAFIGLLVFLCLNSCRSKCQLELGELELFTVKEGQPNCGLDIVEPPLIDPLNACLEGNVIFGPKIYRRESGAPQDFEEDFYIPESGAICVSLMNGNSSDKSTRVSSAIVKVDGEELIAPDSFNKNIPYIEKGKIVIEGYHKISVSLYSQPGSYIEISIKFAPYPYPPHHLLQSSCGHFSIYNLNASPNPFFPPIDYYSTFSINMDIYSLPGFPSGKFSYRIDYAFQILNGTTCDLMRKLEGNIDIQKHGNVSVSEKWDGTDAGGGIVPDGIYYYRFIGTLVKVKKDTGDQEIIDYVISQWQYIYKETPVEVEELWHADTTPSGIFAHVRPILGTRKIIVDAGPTVYKIDALGTKSLIFNEGTERKPKMHPMGNIFGVYKPGIFSVYDEDGTILSSFPSHEYYFFRFIPRSDRILGYHLLWMIEDFGIVDRIDIMAYDGSIFNSINFNNLSISVASMNGNFLFISTDTELIKFNLDGTEQWRLPVQLKNYKVSENGDKLIGVSYQDSKTIFHYEENVLLNSTTLEEPIWDISISPDGIYSIATTSNKVHIFVDASFRKSVTLPLRWTVTADISNVGEIVVSGQSEDHQGHVLLISNWGNLLWEIETCIDGNGWRPYVEYIFDDDTFYIKTRDGISLFSIKRFP